MKVSELVTQIEPFADHRLVIQQADGTFLPVDFVSFVKLEPVNADGSGIALQTPIDANAARTAERYVVLTFTSID